jgi:thiamine biosynthesis lipoprotein
MRLPMYTSTAALKSIGTEKAQADTARLRVGLGTLIAIEAQAAGTQDALAGIDAAFAAIAQVDKLMHPTRPGSDLLAIRHGTLGQPVALHAWTWEVLALSKRVNLASKGAFDPCLPSAAGRLGDLEFMLPHFVIPHRPLHIDLGGIAKGYAVDRSLMALRTAGCRGGLVNAGGDLAVFGDRIHSVVVRAAKTGDCLVELKNAALATSDVGAAAKPPEHRGYYHGADCREIRHGRVAVRAAQAAVADALTKCVLASKGQSSEALLEIFGARLVACDIDS